MENFKDSLKNTTDLRSHLYKAVKITAELTGGLVTAVADNVYGVVASKVNSNENVPVVVAGITRMFAGGTITYANKVTVNASATFVAANSGDTVYGMSKESVASGSYFQGIFFGGLAAETITDA
jgi:hypothetical protein